MCIGAENTFLTKTNSKKSYVTSYPMYRYVKFCAIQPPRDQGRDGHPPQRARRIEKVLVAPIDEPEYRRVDAERENECYRKPYNKIRVDGNIHVSMLLHDMVFKDFGQIGFAPKSPPDPLFCCMRSNRFAGRKEGRFDPVLVHLVDGHGDVVGDQLR